MVLIINNPLDAMILPIAPSKMFFMDNVKFFTLFLLGS